MALDFFAGCLGGSAGVIVGHPFDTIKVILQTQHTRKTRFNGSFDCMKSLLAKEGFRGLYKGLSSPLAGVAGLNAIVFGVYGNVQKSIYISDTNTISSHFWGGCVSGLVQSFICSPIELVKSRLQVSSSHKGPLQCLKDIYRYEGFKGIFRGLPITVARDVPAFGIYFASYEAMTRSKDGRPVSVGTLLLAGGLAGVFSWVVFPVDVIKSRIQIDGMKGTGLYKGSWDCFKNSVATEGVKCLFKGFPVAIFRAFPVNAVCFTVVSITIRIFDKKEAQSEMPFYNFVSDKNAFVNGSEHFMFYATL